ncbi:ATP-binding protein [Pelagicoccus sp. SDUM812002]|uniref:ATP-binding protein n=1 Tax=Pelagicoccus sp. SDUM812002 TaxID=3041266 RepID=UPI00280CE237|nr:ATP-binding protein [Pelagicoccus sp. SDUM812002]MDQ8187585.1 ATP-binding protein [Pelagicoccus sp. SDUM812002]
MGNDGSFRESISLHSDRDVSRARVLVAQWASQQGFSVVERTRAMTAVSEISRNCVIHGGGGTMYVSTLYNNGSPGFRIQIVDQGPGIENLELSMGRGYSTRGGLGLGLDGARKLCRAFRVESNAGAGTTVTLDYWR